MRSLNDFPIHVLSQDEMLTGQAEAVLTEVAEMLDRLLETGRAGSIDLRSLPLSPADRAWLDEQLGRGEVEISLDAGGRSTLSETAYSGVWKVVHRDINDGVIAQLIEVAYVPAIVKATAPDIRKAYENLHSSLKHISG